MDTLRRPAPSPAPADRFEPAPLLRVVVAKDGGASATYEFFQPVVTFGRAQTADIRLDDGNISRLHCTIEIRKDGVYVRDLGSLNGVYMDGERVQDAIITSQSIVKVGPFRFRARQESELPESRFPAQAPVRDDEWTRPGNDLAPSAPVKTLRVPAAVTRPAASMPVPTPAPAPWADREAERTSTSSTLTASEAAQKLLAKQQQRGGTTVTARKAGHVCEACHDGQTLTWGDALACRACWGDGAPHALIARLGEKCPCCHQGLMLTWGNGMRCRNCGNTGTSTRQASRKFRAGDKCPSCVERPMLTWKGGIRCHGCGQSFR